MFIGIAVIIIAYILGSIPSAYVVTRLLTGKDIRKLGGGNAGALNVYNEVGKVAAVAVGIIDVCKGIAAIAIALWLLDFSSFQQITVSHIFVFAAGLAVVSGHIWSVFLRFTGGNGLATTIGVLSVLMTQELLIALVITILITVITRNPVFSMNISLLLSVPISAWLLRINYPPEFVWPYVIFPIILAIIMILHFIPTAKKALNKAGSKENLGAELMRRDGAKK
jgi:glycerol-3-phosphate acyltransferase PlsY